MNSLRICGLSVDSENSDIVSAKQMGLVQSIHSHSKRFVTWVLSQSKSFFYTSYDGLGWVAALYYSRVIFRL